MALHRRARAAVMLAAAFQAVAPATAAPAVWIEGQAPSATCAP